ncbi:hypothetical protein KEM52_001849 [Ascosphaera acerosa]|nr:hypothetical protein KEM52_001849 [Ascosphaera acerosa]
MPLFSRARQSTKQLTSTLTVPKSRRPRFELTLRILDLNNIPLTAGAAWVKWHLPAINAAAEHRGRTDKAAISPTAHTASWAYVKCLPLRMTVDKAGMLNSCEVQFEVIQEFTYEDSAGPGRPAGDRNKADRSSRSGTGTGTDASSNSSGSGSNRERRDDRATDRDRASSGDSLATVGTASTTNAAGSPAVQAPYQDQRQHNDQDTPSPRDEAAAVTLGSQQHGHDQGQGQGQVSKSADTPSPTVHLNTPQTDDAAPGTLSGRRRSSAFSDLTRARSRERRPSSSNASVAGASSRDTLSTGGTAGGAGTDAGNAPHIGAIASDIAAGLHHNNSGKADRVLLGRVKLNLAEYVNEGREDEGVVRRYLMQDSKINSTLRVGISMRLVEGENNFNTPALKSSSVFGGITGVIAEQNEPEEAGRVLSPQITTVSGITPVISGPGLGLNTSSGTTRVGAAAAAVTARTRASSSLSRETGDLQDMYRRTLAAAYVCRGDELPPDEIVENIFSGGDGFRNGWDAFITKRAQTGDETVTTRPGAAPGSEGAAAAVGGNAAIAGHGGSPAVGRGAGAGAGGRPVTAGSLNDDDDDVEDEYYGSVMSPRRFFGGLGIASTMAGHGPGPGPLASHSRHGSDTMHMGGDGTPGSRSGSGSFDSDRPRRYPSTSTSRHRPRRSQDMAIGRRKDRSAGTVIGTGGGNGGGSSASTSSRHAGNTTMATLARLRRTNPGEISEFEVRDDLRSWSIGPGAALAR